MRFMEIDDIFYTDILLKSGKYFQVTRIELDKEKKYKIYGEELGGTSKVISMSDIKKMMPGMDIIGDKRVEDKIGEEFSGIISGIAEHGIYVKMTENNCEGMVSMQDIPGDRYYFDADKFRVIGSKNKREYNLGDMVTVRIYEVNPRKRQIDLELVL